MLTSSKESATGAVFHNAHSDSDFHQVYRNNMDDTSYVGITKVVEKVLTNPKTAFWETEPYIDDTVEYKSCQVLIFLQSIYLKIDECLTVSIKIR